ncbi:hypothetical protein M9H77_35915 [Catharanthus roseus]|uniref:Uncharacterized protein n=1 Tax=Catharanthus roseus TaxID=4058 RepID=A0ACB9ZQN2_CATRO|nr:hypothetical protein M9H77_35915 [Catharanthus roseus]
MRSLITVSIETTSIDTSLIGITPTADVPVESIPPPTDQAPIEELCAISKIPESAIDDTQLGNADLPFHTPMMSKPKNPRLLKDDFQPILAEYAKSKRFYESSCVQNFDLLKSRGFVVETSFLGQSLIDHGLFELLVNPKLLNCTKYSKRYNESLVREFHANMDESIVDMEPRAICILEIQTHSDIDGIGWKDDIDLDMVIGDWTDDSAIWGYMLGTSKPISMGQLQRAAELQRQEAIAPSVEEPYYVDITQFKTFNRGLLLSAVMSANCKPRLLLLKPHRSDFVIV